MSDTSRSCRALPGLESLSAVHVSWTRFILIRAPRIWQYFRPISTVNLNVFSKKMWSQWWDTVDNNFTPTDPCLTRTFLEPIFPTTIPSRNLAVARGWNFLCTYIWNIFSMKWRITHRVFWLMFAVLNWKDQNAVRSKSLEFQRPGLIQVLSRHSKYYLNPCLLNLAGALTITDCHRKLPLLLLTQLLSLMLLIILLLL